jgi:hypothetical protein
MLQFSYESYDQGVISMTTAVTSRRAGLRVEMAVSVERSAKAVWWRELCEGNWNAWFRTAETVVKVTHEG